MNNNNKRLVKCCGTCLFSVQGYCDEYGYVLADTHCEILWRILCPDKILNMMDSIGYEGCDFEVPTFAKYPCYTKSIKNLGYGKGSTCLNCFNYHICDKDKNKRDNMFCGLWNYSVKSPEELSELIELVRKTNPGYRKLKNNNND